MTTLVRILSIALIFSAALSTTGCSGKQYWMDKAQNTSSPMMRAKYLRKVKGYMKDGADSKTPIKHVRYFPRGFGSFIRVIETDAS